jgi:flagellar biosynthetic protein FliP
MLKQTREPDLALFVRLSRVAQPKTKDDIPLRVLVPAFVTSELKTAFQIGFMVFIPFLIIDMVVASVLMSMGMMMLSPVLISLPFKLMLFVLVDGWNLLLGSLVASFG